MTDHPIEPAPASPFRAGTVALVGRPNAGKSTLLNAILGQKLAIISPKPQTTRNRIVGIHHAPDLQVVLVDTPGIHPAKSRLNRAMVHAATTSLLDVDVVSIIVDATKAADAARQGRAIFSQGDDAIADTVIEARRAEGNDAVVVVLNKIDLVDKRWLLPVIDAWSKRIPGAVVVPISARKRQGLEDLLAEWKKLLPLAEPIYPPDMLTEHPEKFFVAELIREKVVMLTEEELPYATAVEIEEFDETQRDSDKKKIVIHARIYVARDSQKGIVIGKGGNLLKKIQALARKDIEVFLDARVQLHLRVVLKKEWPEDERVLKALGYEP